MSGGGKSTVIKMLEDSAYYCVDNLPPPLIDKFIELCMENHEIKKVALGVDARGTHHFGNVSKQLAVLKQKGYAFELLFMDAADSVLMNRYKESRRTHPLTPEGRIEDGIIMEREMLASMKTIADYVIDTSNLLVRELGEEIERIFVRNEEYNSLIVNLVSFGFKNGVPSDADMVFDVRFLPNPFYIEDLKERTGEEQSVRDYVMSHAEAGVFLDKLTDMVNFLIPAFVKEGKHQLIIGIGCTGGRHRSVTFVYELYERLKDKGNYMIKQSHRDVLIKQNGASPM
jgi:UPF0042 nucleotide-binding protein